MYIWPREEFVSQQIWDSKKTMPTYFPIKADVASVDALRDVDLNIPVLPLLQNLTGFENGGMTKI